MLSYFNYNFNFPFGMNNWFMPSTLFQDFNMFFDLSYFNSNSNNNYFNNIFNFNTVPVFQAMSNSYLMPNIFSQHNNTQQKQTKVENQEKIDTFTKTTNTAITKTTNEHSLDDYNAKKGKRLAEVALNRSIGWTGFCARYVKNSILAANLGSFQYGHAYQMTDILRKNSNFKEISTEGVDVSKLPAGCILVYGKGVEGYSKKYGHTEITTGDGRAVSDGITKHLYKKPSAIFIPV